MTPAELTFGQPHFVCLATNILTGLHGMCLLVVMLWFVYQLKHDSVWAVWIRAVLKSIMTIADRIFVKGTRRIRKGMEWIWTGIKIGTNWVRTRPRCIWNTLKWPYDKYKRNLHLQRNIFWYIDTLYYHARSS